MLTEVYSNTCERGDNTSCSCSILIMLLYFITITTHFIPLLVGGIVSSSRDTMSNVRTMGFCPHGPGSLVIGNDIGIINLVNQPNYIVSE